MRERLEHAAAWTALKLLGWLPRPVGRWTAACLAALIFQLRPAWRRIALFNLRLAFPDWPEDRRRRVVRDMVRHLGWMAAEFAHFPRLTRENIARLVVADGLENFAAAESFGKGVILLGGHMGAWELTPVAHALYTKPLSFLMRPIDNSSVDALVNGYRAACGNRPINKNQSARPMLRALRERGVVGILADLNTASDEAAFVDFFGIPAATTTGIGRLARHTGAPVVPIYVYWDDALGKYRLHYDPPLAIAHTEDAEADIRASTTQFNFVIESYVRRFPDQWLWVHRRWKSRPPGEEPIYSN